MKTATITATLHLTNSQAAALREGGVVIIKRGGRYVAVIDGEQLSPSHNDVLINVNRRSVLRRK